MKIAPMRERITFEARTIIQDEIGNESSQWLEIFSRWASANRMSSSETEQLKLTSYEEVLVFTLRYDSRIEQFDTQKIRVKFDGHTYNIHSIDNLQFQNRIIKIRASLEKEDEDTS